MSEKTVLQYLQCAQEDIQEVGVRDCCLTIYTNPIMKLLNITINALTRAWDGQQEAHDSRILAECRAILDDE
jgi:hypothetical protein